MMSVAVAGDAVRQQIGHDLARLPERGDSLQRQAVDQVEIQILNAGATQPRHGRLDVLHRLPPADRSLHQRIDVLHAKAGAVDAERLQAFRQTLCHISRVELDGMFVTGFEDEAVTQRPA